MASLRHEDILFALTSALESQPEDALIQDSLSNKREGPHRRALTQYMQQTYSTCLVSLDSMYPGGQAGSLEDILGTGCLTRVALQEFQKVLGFEAVSSIQ